MNFSLLSHPHKLLVHHVSNVLCNARTIYEDIPLADDIKRSIDICCLFHDIGKASKFFQDYITAIRDGKRHNASDRRKNHAAIGAVWAYQSTKEQGYGDKLAFLTYLCVLNHHGSLSNFNDMLPSVKIDHVLQ
ncbi:MAG: CRISPR-associated endonuclease Cas3'', partial [Bacteroidota bacterium]|nr:CRISPR-associated endonuclease Cas3'' [Candidatus Kapabacteria bacterium]MDW8221246.1 CRISPR-associated endonuclease Cas3'' [Bacteroidota bacterium]